MRIFLDANVIADWLLVAPEILKINETDRDTKLEALWKTYSAPKVSFEILEALRLNNIKKKTKFFSSELAISEVGDVIFRELRSKSLAEKGIAFRYIPKMIKKTILTNGEINDILERVKVFRLTFLEDKILLHDKVRDPTLILYILSLFRIETYDAYLISQAVDSKCKYFVTKDEDLRKDVKTNVIKLISPEELVGILAKNK